MNDFDMNNFGTPNDGVEEFRKRFYGELEGGQQAGGLVADTHTPSAESVVNRVDWADAARKSLQRDEERTKRVHGLRGLVLYDKDEVFRNAVSEHNDLSFMVDDRVRADKPGFNMLLGGELSRTLGDGDTFGVLNETIDALPSEQQLDAKARMQKCDTEYKAKELLGELWSGLIVKDYEDQKAEAEKKIADMKAARAEWQKVYEAKGLDRMMKGLDIPLEMRDMVMLERAGLKPEAINEVRATHQRASKAWDKLMRWMYGTSYSQAKMKARVVGEALKKGWDNELHLPWTEKPTDEDFYQQGAAELSESFDLNREQMAELLQTMRDENGQLDKQAMAMFLMAMEKEAASTQTVIHSKFWRNFGEAVADWARETGDYFYNSRYNLIINNPLALNIPFPTQVFLWLQGEEARQEYIEEVQRTRNADVETLKGWMTRFDKKRVEAAERADFLTDLSADSGTTWGASTPMIVANTAIPGWGGMIAGAAVTLPAMTNEAVSENYAKGVKNPELMAVIESVMQTGAEGLFMAGASKLPFVGQAAKKLTGWAGMKAKAIDWVGKMVGATQGRAWARYGLGVAAETFGEIVVEDFVAETGTYATVKVLRAMGANLAEPEWEPFENVLKTMQDPGQTGATIGLCAALGLLGIPGNARAARSFAADRKMLLQAGLTEGGIAEVQHELKEFEGRVSKALVEAQPRLSEVRAEAEAKAVAEAEAKAGRPLSEEELAEAKKNAGDKAVAEEVEKIRDREQEPLNEKMREVYKRDVLHADPVAVKKRMEERGKKFLEDIELKMYADSKVMEYVLRKTGVIVGEQTSEGKYKVALKGDKEGETHEVEWTEEQLKAYVAMEHTEGQLAMMRELQARVAGEALAKADRSIGGEIVNLAEMPIRALARMERNGGRVDYAVLQDLAEDARDKIGGFVTEGMSWTEASSQMSEIPGVTLGTLVNTADAFVKRVDEAFATGEAQELGLEKPEDAATNVFRVNKAGSAGQSILLYNRGKMNEREFVEDHIERDVVAAVEGENATTSWEALETMLRRVDAEMVKNGGARIFKKDATGKDSVIEAFSKLAQSYFLLNHWNYNMSAEAHATIEYVQKNLKGAQYLMTLSHAWDAFSQSKEGKEYIQKEGASLEKLLSDAGASVAGKYAAAKMDADSAAVVLEAYESSSMASVKLAMEEAAKADAEQSKAREAEPTEIPASESITGEPIPLEEETEEVAEKAEPVELDERGQRMKDAEDRMKAGRATVVDVAYYFRNSGMTLAEAEERGLVSRNEDGELSSVYTLGMKLAEDASDDTVNGLVEGSVDVKDAVVATTAATTESGQQVALQALAEGKSVEETTALVRVGEKMAGQEDVAELMAEDAEFKARVEETAKNVAAERAVLQEQIAKAETADEAKALAEQDAALERGEVEALSEQEAETKADEGGTFSLASQREIIDRLKGDKELGRFMRAVDKVEGMKERNFKQTDIKLGVLSDESLNRLLQQNPGWPDSYDLRNAEHVINETDIWHIYRGHCLDYYLKDDGLNLTYDDIRMIPDILQNYDTITPDYKDGRWGVVYEKNYGGVEYRYSAYISKPHRRSGEPQTVHLTTGWLIKKAVAGDGLTPQQPQATSASRFHRTAIVTPMEEYIKQNYAEEAKNIALIAKNKSNALHAPNGKITNLTPVQWLAVRLQSFKAWFGDWEKDPANASKVVDENGEPKVVTHATNSEPFTVFKRGERAGLSGKGIYFSPDGVGIWGKNLMHCFLNVRNPLTKENAPREVNNGGMSAVDPDVFEHFPQFDGVMLRKDEITVRDPNQIKSATDNRGTFDGGNADITFSIAMEIQDNLLKQEFSSKDTSINSTKAPAVFGAVEKKLGGWKSGTVNVDIGGGRFDTLTDKLAEKGVTNFIYEPFGRTIAHNAYILGELRDRTTLGDTATCSNVLNVIKEAEIRANVIHQVAKAIKGDGVAYFTIYEGDRTGEGKRTKDDCWQENRKTATYVDEVKQFFGDVELKGGVIVARTPLHVNEPAVWKLGSDSETDFATFSLSANLAAVHTLSADKFLKAAELGGMPLPSVAVTRLDRPYGWGGASSINLIGRPSMVDPAKGTSVYSADAWAGKYPRTEHKRANKEDFERTMESADELTKRYGNLYMSIRGRLGQKLDPEELRASLESEDGKALFAAVSGYFPKAKMKAARSHHPYFDKQFAKETKNMWEGDGIRAGQEMSFADAVEAALERFLAKQGKFADIYRKLHAEDVEKLRTQGAETAFMWWQMRRSYENIGKQELDGTATHAAIIAYADKHKKAYQKWVAEKVEAWLTKESYISENGKEATLENVTAYMLKNKGLNKEKFPGFNEGKLRAARSTRMRSIADIQARRESLSDSKTSTDSKLVTNAKLRGFTSRVRAVMDRMAEDGFYASDYGLEALSKVKGKPTVEGVKEGLRKVFSYRPKLLQALLEDVDLLGCGVDALESLRAEVEDYMEAVPNRAVLMDEWQYAVMPENLRKNKAVQKALRENGIKAVYHDGTMPGRDAALAGLVGNERVSFSLAGASVLDGRVELNAVTAKDPEAREHMRNIMLNRHNLTESEVEELFAIMDGIVAKAEGLYGEYPVFKAWNERGMDRYKDLKVGFVPKLSAFKANGDYKFNIDLGTLCAKREALDWLAQLMMKEGLLVNLGPVQIERLKDLLKSMGLATACDVCFVEAKRYRMLQDSVKTSFYWRAVCEAVGITDTAPVGTPRVLTAEQEKRLKEMANNKSFKSAYKKYVLKNKMREKGLDLGLTASMMNKLAKLFIDDVSLMGVLEPMRLMTTAGVDELLRNYAKHTNIAATLAGMYGSGTAKPLEGFLVYDPLSWRKSFDGTPLSENYEMIDSLGGGRAQSFTDFSPVLFLDYVQMVADFAARLLPMHVYTKVPAFVKLFGQTGIMVNMSFVPEIADGVDAEHAGLKRGKNGEWEYAWSKDSFPIDEAYALREREDFGGRVGIIAVGVSDAHIKMLLDDPRIDMVIPYHASGMPVLVKNKTGLKNATDYTDVQTTRPKEGGKRKAKWSYNEALRRLKDPRKAVKDYLQYCKKNKFIPKFEQFKDHPNYYKLLEDFRGYDNAGKAVIQGAVRLKLPDNWQDELRVALGYRQWLENKFETLGQDEEFLNKAREILKHQPLDGKVREVMMARLKSALPDKNGVQSLSQGEFLDKLEEVLTDESSVETAKARVEVFRKGDGVVYGFAHRGTIYLNETCTNANTPAHEFTHVWAKVAQNVNGKLWKKGVELLKQTDEWQEVMKDSLYENIRGDENAVASEVLARLAGKENEAFVRMLVDPDAKPLEKHGIIAKVMEWLSEMWKSVRSIFDAPGGKKLTLQEFSRMPIKDLWDETRNKQFAEAAREVLGKGIVDMRAEMEAEHAEAHAEAPSFALGSDMAAVMAEWENTLDGYLQSPPQPGTPEHTRDLVVCPTPAVMQMVGAKGLDMVVTPGVLDKVMNDKHAVTEDALRQLPAALAEPVCIAVSDTPGCLEVITELKEGEHNVLVAVQLDSEHSSLYKVKVNRIASMYGKERIGALLNHPMLYWDKAKARPWVNNYRLQLPAPIQPRRASGRRIQTPADLVKYKMERGLSFSLSGPSILDTAPTGRMAGEEKMQRLLNYARKESARWGRTFSKEIPTAKAAEAMGTVSSLLASIHKELPPKYRPKVDANMRYVEVYARLIESGKIRTYGKLSKEERAAVEAELMDVLREEQQRVDAEYEQAKAEALQTAALTGEMAALEEAENMDVEDEVQRAAYLERVAKRAEAEARKRLLAEAEAKKKQLDAEVEALKREFGAEKLGAIAKRMLTDAANSVERYLIDTTLDIVPKLLERLAPKKLPNGKFDKGKMSADAYRKFMRYVEMIDSTAEEVAERMEALGLQIAAEEAKSDKEKEQVDGDKLEALQAELAEWSTYGNLRGKRLEAVRAGVQALIDFAAYEKNAWQGMLQLKRARVKRQALKAAEALGGADEHKVKQVVEKEEGLLRKAGNLLGSFQSLSQMFYALGGVPELRALADESLDALSAGHVALTMREKRAYEQLAEFMKTELGLDTENKRNDFMAALKKLHDTGIRKEGEVVRHKLRLEPKAAAMWLAMTKEERDAKRAEMEADADKRGVLVENVPFEEDIPLIREALDKYNEKPAGKKWVHTEREFRREGPAETMKLSKDEALNILLLCEQDDYVDAAADNGYTAEVLDQLREFVGSDVLSFGYVLRDVLENNGLAEVYEAREGVPFPKVANYWPGNFDQSARANEQANALDPTSGNGTRYGMLITRVKHNLKFNILGATNVFMAALAQQNNYIVIGELTAKWRGLLSHSDFAMALKAHMGEARFKTLKELINLLDGAGVQESITQQALSGMTAMFQSAHAMAVLAGSPLTLIKQVSAMFNAGAWQGISMSRVAARLILDRAGKGAIKYADMLKKDYFQARYKDNRYFTAMLQLGRDANWSRLSKLARSAMNLIEATDVASNCFAMTALYNITYHDLKHRNKDAVDPLTEEEIHAECDRVVRNTLELGAQPLRRTQKSAFAALGNRNAVVKTLCYMNSEALNKIGMALATMKREGGGWKGGLKAWKYIAAMSFAQQLVIMAIDMWRGAAPIDDDEWAKWALLNLATGATGLGILQTVPVLGEALQWGSGGYIKTGSMGEMVYDFGGMAREMKKGLNLVMFNSEDSVEIKKSRKSPYWQVTYKKQDGSRVTTSTDVPVEGGEFEGVELSKEEAEAKALEVGKRIAEEDAPGWADWGLMGSNLLRYGAAFTGAWKGINSTSKVMSELSGMLQSLNAVANTVRPFMQAERNEEKRVKEYNTKLEKGFREARKKTNERLKKQREEEKKKKDAAKKREQMLKQL